MQDNKMGGHGLPPRIDTNLENQIQFIDFILENNPLEIIIAIRDSLMELKAIKERGEV